MDDLKIISTVEELEELDEKAYLMTRSGTCKSALWFKAVLSGFDYMHTAVLPAVVIATGEQVRAARKALNYQEQRKFYESVYKNYNP